ncbi:MAG: nuclear transport factor 2 family protein [Burkholderiaceae bacterium]|nr:nuclear transport factor 2 family protein [Burkholderiaceae bacterium]
MPSEIIKFFQAYRDAFNTLNGGAVAMLYAEPSGIAQDGRYTHWPNRVPVQENMEALCQMYRNKGFVRADFELGQFIDQGEQFAVADLQWQIDWDRDQDSWRFRTTYNLVYTGKGWKVLLCTAYTEAALFNAERVA